MFREIPFLICLISTPSILGADTPLRGTLIGQSSGDILQYSCNELDDGDINCDFIQIVLSVKATEDEWPEMLEEFRMAFDEDDVSLGEFCDSVIEPVGRFMADGMPADTSPYNTDQLDMSQFFQHARLDIEFFAEWAKAGQRYCETREFEDLSAFFRLGHEQDMKTCEPFINDYSQRYTRSTENQWVVSEPPSGACGIINTSRFIREEGHGILWRHEASKVITNPEATTGLGLNCSVFDESITNYEWNSSRIRLGCEYID
ncbi:hypothetical protein [Loktanella sp. S4079]|uniref:hypothetical protein n=1 Tax=Loktanella sp. S4079 TaxID=579483 RepID=UPI000B11C745|nr:hypothetical protein [Loktanella sp. S4079]